MQHGKTCPKSRQQSGLDLINKSWQDKYMTNSERQEVENERDLMESQLEAIEEQINSLMQRLAELRWERDYIQQDLRDIEDELSA
jgi:septal ring factor EnvC (AmiA/AmiB activator)